MTKGQFRQLVAEALDSLPAEFQERLENVAVIVEDAPEKPRHPRTPGPRDASAGRRRLLGVFEGVPATQRSVFNIASGPARIVLFQDNIEAVCRSEAEIRHQIRMTVIHEIGHYFGMSEEQLRDV